MANKQLFQSRRGKAIKACDTYNQAGGKAYKLSKSEALAQMAVTGTLNNTFYADAETQLETALDLATSADVTMLAKTAIYARREAKMKDMPALLLAVLAGRDTEMFKRIFDRVIDNGKLLRTFVQIMRSGLTGRQSLGNAPKRMVQRWLATRTPDYIFRNSVGQAPSLGDVIKMAHPKPATGEHEALFAYLIDKQYDFNQLPQSAQRYSAFKEGRDSDIPAELPIQLLSALELSRADWTQIALRSSWQSLRMNLNTFLRHGVFNNDDTAAALAERLRSRSLIAKANAFPYQLFAAYKNVNEAMPRCIIDALHDAMEAATANVPALEGNVVLCPDVSGSMQSAISGYRKGASSKVRCVDVAALVAASFLRNNPNARVLPFDTMLYRNCLSSRDSVLRNAKTLSGFGGWGTNCSLPLRYLVEKNIKADIVIYISDCESWADASRGRGTDTMKYWQRFKSRNPRAKLVCIDIQPATHTQAYNARDVLNIGGFSDSVFRVIETFYKREGASFLDVINTIELD